VVVEFRDSGAEDDRLVARAREGDSSAFDELLRHHETKVLRVLRLLGIPPADREDVAQDVFLRVFRHLDRFRPGRSFGAWLYRITVNAAHDHRRRLSQRERIEPAYDVAEEPADSGPGPHETAEAREGGHRLERALEALSERERAVFVLCELESLETRGVARSLGISAITVRRHLGRARRHLREELEKS